MTTQKSVPHLVEGAFADKGAEIRAKVAENRDKRLAIAEAMKREAGVTGHEVNREGFGGLAFIGTGRIRSPAGENMRQLYIVAHECGHIFLHNDGAGYWLPSHVKEMEAECYAHQAFREHGMNLSRRFSDWGRSYVAEWIEKDRAAGIAIDPRAISYAGGYRSPYAPLRDVPATWRLHGRETRGAIDGRDAIAEATRKLEQEFALRAAERARAWRDKLRQDARLWFSFTATQFLYSYVCAELYLIFLRKFPFLPSITYFERNMTTLEATLACACIGLIWACVAASFRTWVR